MKSTNSGKRHALLFEDLDSWTKVDPTAFSSERKEAIEQLYRQRAEAILLYAQRRPLREIFEKTGIGRQELYRLRDRCLKNHPDGSIFGFRGLTPHARVGANSTKDLKKLEDKVPKPGSLTALFAKYPSIYKQLHDLAVLGKRQGYKQLEVDVPINAIHKEFIRLCDEKNIQYPHYPFNSSSEGRPAIRRWVKDERLRHQLRYLKTADPQTAKNATARGQSHSSAPEPTRCYRQVECDGHRIDLHCKLEMPSPAGEGTISVEISRLWIIVLIELVSRCVIGYSFSFQNANYAATDVIRAVRNSLMPWRPRKLTVTTINYKEGDGLPSGVIEGLSYTCFDELHIDNAKAHLGYLFQDYMDRVVGCVPVFSPAATPNAHAFVEGFFDLLEDGGIHQLPGTTGSSREDRRRTKAGSNLQYHLTYELLADFIDLYISRINNTPAPNSTMTRLEVLQRAVNRKLTIFRRIPESSRHELMRLDMCEPGKIGKDHNRVVVRFHGAVYFSDMLTSAFQLVGRAITITANSEDLRTIECTLDDGTLLGTLIAERRWRQTQHGLITRRMITKLLNQGFFSRCDDLPVAFRKHLELEAKKSKKAAAQLKRIHLEQERQAATPPHPSDAGHDGECFPIHDNQDEPKSQEKKISIRSSLEEAALAEARELLLSIGAKYR